MQMHAISMREARLSGCAAQRFQVGGWRFAHRLENLIVSKFQIL